MNNKLNLNFIAEKTFEETATSPEYVRKCNRKRLLWVDIIGLLLKKARARGQKRHLFSLGDMQ